MVRALEPLRARWQALPTTGTDAAIAVAVSAVELFNLYRELVVHGCACELPVPAATALLLITTLPLAWRRRFPFGVANVVGIATLLVSGLDVPSLGFGALVGIFTASSWASPLKRRIALTILVVAIATNPFIEGDFEALPEDAITFGTAWALGALARTRRAYITELEGRAERLEREREERTRLAIAEERARIARELHDVVAHTISVMVVQTQAARSVLAHDPRRADEALERVESSGRRSLADVRRLLGLLRHEDEGASLAPQPGLGQLDDLLARFGAAGLIVDLEVSGEPRPVDPAVDLSAYRIVQESLTNVLKHSGCRRARLSVEWLEHGLRLEVVDRGRGAASPTNGFGHGLAGMRERASLVAGRLSAGNRPGGGFGVMAELPTDGGR